MNIKRYDLPKSEKFLYSSTLGPYMTSAKKKFPRTAKINRASSKSINTLPSAPTDSVIVLIRA